jgi:hypothetical protein
VAQEPQVQQILAAVVVVELIQVALVALVVQAS